MRNWEKCLNSVRLIHDEINTVSKLNEVLSFMNDKNRTTFKKCWGLQTPALNLEDSDKDNIWLDYHSALAEFDRIAYNLNNAKFFSDYKRNVQKAMCYGNFLSTLFGISQYSGYLTTSEMEDRLNKAFTFLTPFERKVITLEYGLEDYSSLRMGVTVVAEILGKSDYVVVAAENRAFNRLRQGPPLEIITRG